MTLFGREQALSVPSAVIGVALASVAFGASFFAVTQISGGAEPETEPDTNAAPSAAGVLSSAQEEVPDVRAPAFRVPHCASRYAQPRERLLGGLVADRQSPAGERALRAGADPAPAPVVSLVPAPEPAPAPKPPPPVRFYDEG